MEVAGSWKDHDYEGRPVPDPDTLSAEYWEAAGRGELRYQECPACHHRQFYPRLACTECGTTPEWRTSAGRGTVHTFTVVRKNLAPPFNRLVPYVVAVIELDEGPRMLGNVTDCDPDLVRIGTAVIAHAVVAEGAIAVPFWRPADEGDR